VQSAAPWVTLLQSENPGIRLQAVGEMYFGEIAYGFEGDYAELVEGLIRHQILVAGSPDYQMELDLSREVLKSIGTASIEPLIGLLEGEDEMLWFTAAKALGENTEPASLNALLAAISSSDQIKVLAGLSGLDEYLWNTGPVELDLGIGFDNLAALLNDTSIHSHYHTLALQVIVDSGDPRGRELLVGLLESGSAVVSEREVISALGDLGDPVALPSITARFDSTDQEVKLAVVAALGEIGGSEVVDLLVVAIQDDDHDIRMEALESLNNLDDEALAPLLAALDNQDIEKIAQAYMFFITWGPEGKEYLLNRALTEYGTRQMAIHFLNCGNPILEEGARSWAEDHGYAVIDLSLPDVGDNPVGWGAGN
jgi:HEAT repeat protein